MGSLIPFQGVLFPDTELLIVAALKALLERAGEPSNSYRVGTRKLTPQANTRKPLHQVIIRADGSEQLDIGIKQEALTILIFTNSSSSSEEYAAANAFALKVESLLPLTPLISSGGLADVGSISMQPVDDDGEEEVREINFAAVLKGADFTI